MPRLPVSISYPAAIEGHLVLVEGFADAIRAVQVAGATQNSGPHSRWTTSPDKKNPGRYHDPAGKSVCGSGCGDRIGVATDRVTAGNRQFSGMNRAKIILFCPSRQANK